MNIINLDAYRPRKKFDPKILTGVRARDIWTKVDAYRKLDLLPFLTVRIVKKEDLVDLHMQPSKVFDHGPQGYDRSRLTELVDAIDTEITIDINFAGVFYSLDGPIEALGPEDE